MRLLLLLMLLPLALPAGDNLVGLGASYNSPSAAGSALWARRIAGDTWAFTALDALPASYRPLQVTTQVGIGIAQKILTLGKVEIFIPTNAGISWTGTNLGWSWTGGGLASIPIGATNWRIQPHVRFIKSSVSGSSYQLIGGVLFGWEW